MTLLKNAVKARDLMTPDPICVDPSTRIRELAAIFEEHDISGVPVVDQQGKLVGVVTKTDLIRKCAEGTDDLPPAYLFEVLSDQGNDDDSADIIPEPLVCVEDFMTEDPVTVGPQEPIASVARLMSDKRIHRVIVIDEQLVPLGVVTSMDLIGLLAR